MKDEGDKTNEQPSELQILPMNPREDPEFRSYNGISELQQKFFLKNLKIRNGKYLYRTSGLKYAPGKVILFQASSQIIASATLREVKKEQEYDAGTLYNGSLYFDVNSIMTFDPIPWSTVQEIWPEAKRASQTKRYLNPDGYAAFKAAQKQTTTH